MARLSDAEKMEVVNKYASGMTVVDIAKIYNRWPNGIKSILKVRGVKIRNNRSEFARKYNINQHYFDNIDTEDKAYFLGLMYADGWNLEDRYLIGIRLQEEDKYIIEKLIEKIEYTGKLKFIKGIGNRKNSYEIRMSGEHLSHKLSEIGCWSNKSLTLKFPKDGVIPDKLMRHFIRGYLDGDGYICVNKRKRGNTDYSCYITSTSMFCEPLKEFIKEKLGVHSTICYCNRRKDKTTRQLSIAGRIQTKKFLDWLYRDATIYLERKHQKYLKF